MAVLREMIAGPEPVLAPLVLNPRRYIARPALSNERLSAK